MTPYIAILALVLSPLVGLGQATPDVVTDVALFTSPTGIAGSWAAIMSSGTNPLNRIPLKVGIHCSNDGSGAAGTWVPCQLPLLQVYDVRAYGAKVDGSTDDTAAVNAAVSAALAAGGGIVFIPAGTMITQPIQGASNVSFRGTGTSQSTWKLIANATAVAPSGSGSCSTTASVLIECWTSGWVISDLTFDGNRTNQTASISYGIYESAVGYTSTTKTPPRIERVTVQFTKSDGIHVDAASTGQGIHSAITVYGASGVGIYAGAFDTQWTSINVGESGLQGILAVGSTQHFTSVKSWFSGTVTPTSGNGFESTAASIQCDSCEMQDNQANGLKLTGAINNVFQGLSVVGNNRTSATSGSGVALSNATGNVITGNSTGGIDFPASQLYAIAFSGTSANNHIRLTSSGNTTGLINGTYTNEDVQVIDSGGTAAANLIGLPTEAASYFGTISTTTANSLATAVITPTVPITITRVEWSFGTIGTGCTTTPVLSILVANVATSTVPITSVNSAFQGHVDGNTAVPANSLMQIKTTTAAAGCTGAPGSATLTIHWN